MYLMQCTVFYLHRKDSVAAHVNCSALFDTGHVCLSEEMGFQLIEAHS